MIESPPGPGAVGTGSHAGLRVLTVSQYANTVHDLLGDDVPLADVGQWRSSIGAAQGGVSAAGVEQYEGAARAAAAHVFASTTRGIELLGCEPTAAANDPCMTRFITSFGRRAWRRPLSPVEVMRYQAVAANATSLFGDAWRGAEATVVALLQSPNFIYRVELGEVDPESQRTRFTGYEMATRISYLVSNSGPDLELLDAAERGELVSADGIRDQVQRLMASPKARVGVVRFFADLFDLDAIAIIEKDGTLVPQFSPTIGAAIRDQLVRTIEDVILDGTGDYRDLFDTRTTFMNDELAALYQQPGTFGAEMSRVTLSADGPRAGILSLAAINALHSGLADTSPTLRGKYIRMALLCQSIPPPPPGVITTLPENTVELGTTRERMAIHQSEPLCASCHKFMDPIGYALEPFDAIGAYRATQNGFTIDPSGDLDGVPFADARGLGKALRDHPDLASCLVKNVFRYASAQIEESRHQDALDEVTQRFVEGGHGVALAFELIATSDSFRYLN